MNELFVKLSPGIAAILGSAITAIVMRKKTKKETLQLEIENIQKVVNLWESMVGKLTIEVQLLSGEVASLRKENSDLKMEIRKLEKLLQQYKQA